MSMVEIGSLYVNAAQVESVRVSSDGRCVLVQLVSGKVLSHEPGMAGRVYEECDAIAAKISAALREVVP